ncbi:hypothetical protein SOVF_158490 [Spinacia oleracea]|nr:hypothetical protein SOVF_158490 [Spinacia oleracea]
MNPHMPQGFYGTRDPINANDIAPKCNVLKQCLKRKLSWRRTSQRNEYLVSFSFLSMLEAQVVLCLLSSYKCKINVMQ